MRELRASLNSSEKTGMVVSEQDEIAWLFNLRGEGNSTMDSLMMSPLFQSIALVTMDSIGLWVHGEKVTDEVRDHLNPSQCEEENMCVVFGDFPNALLDLADWAEFQTEVSLFHNYVDK